jgi:hypothetical protein
MWGCGVYWTGFEQEPLTDLCVDRNEPMGSIAAWELLNSLCAQGMFYYNGINFRNSFQSEVTSMEGIYDALVSVHGSPSCISKMHPNEASY